MSLNLSTALRTDKRKTFWCYFYKAASQQRNSFQYWNQRLGSCVTLWGRTDVMGKPRNRLTVNSPKSKLAKAVLGDLYVGGQETQRRLELVLERNTQRLISSFKWWLKIWARGAWQWNNYLVFCLPNVKSELQRPDAVLLEQLAIPLLSVVWSWKHQLRNCAAAAP